VACCCSAAFSFGLPRNSCLLHSVKLYRELVGNAERQAATTIEEYGSRMKAVKSVCGLSQHRCEFQVVYVRSFDHACFLEQLQKQVAIAERKAKEKRDSEWLNQANALKEELQTLQAQVAVAVVPCPCFPLHDPSVVGWPGENRQANLSVHRELVREAVSGPRERPCARAKGSNQTPRRVQQVQGPRQQKWVCRASICTVGAAVIWGAPRGAVFLAIPLLIVSVQYFLSDTYYAPKYTEWMMVLAHVWLMYYYVSLSLRENILRVVRAFAYPRLAQMRMMLDRPQNGSAIRPWWIYHHYLSALMSVVMLTWPRTETYNRFSSHFTVRFCFVLPGAALEAPWIHNVVCLQSYFIYQGFVQLLQAWYQKRRHYALRSLGRVSLVQCCQQLS
jgi:hypothetical protein